jgi:hypothetical protein
MCLECDFFLAGGSGGLKTPPAWGQRTVKLPVNNNSGHLSRVQPESGPVTGLDRTGVLERGGVLSYCSKQIGMNPAIEVAPTPQMVSRSTAHIAVLFTLPWKKLEPPVPQEKVQLGPARPLSKTRPKKAGGSPPEFGY